MLESFAIAIIFAAAGFMVGSRSRRPTGSLSEKAVAYRELLDALYVADRALGEASMAEVTKETLQEGTKEAVRSALKAMSRVLERNRFLYTEAVCEAVDGALERHLGIEWTEWAERLRHARQSVLVSARKEMG